MMTPDEFKEFAQAASTGEGMTRKMLLDAVRTIEELDARYAKLIALMRQSPTMKHVLRCYQGKAPATKPIK